jgi:hypothetical protein
MSRTDARIALTNTSLFPTLNRGFGCVAIANALDDVDHAMVMACMNVAAHVSAAGQKLRKNLSTASHSRYPPYPTVNITRSLTSTDEIARGAAWRASDARNKDTRQAR